jgi:arabinofuranosyltransferase
VTGNVQATRTVRSRLTLTRGLIVLAAAVGLYLGWRLFWFLTDDAYILYRYVSNSMLGYGYTWNAPPFRPVEGYTSFLWVVILDVVWRVFGVEPPDAANTLGLGFAFGTLLLAVAMLYKLPLRPTLERVRVPLVLLALIGILSNRTFLAWSSSGLETALFNLLLTGWVYVALFVAPAAPWRMPAIVGLAVLTALTRPDGLLLVTASAVPVAQAWWRTGRAWRPGGAAWLTLVPLAGLAAHFVWRRLTYGEWLPNTFAAKYVSPWPESGWRYALSFIMEYALWFWLGLIVALIVWRARDGLRGLAQARQVAVLTRAPALTALAVLGALSAHAGYYTLIIGGDFFEYRVYSHLIVLIFVSTVWLLNALGAGARLAVAYLGLFVLAGLPIPWVHWWLSQPLTTREQTQPLRVQVAPVFPEPVRAYVGLFDTLQAWLIEHGVCIRHQTHKIFALDRTGLYPSRARGLLLAGDGRPVFVAGAVGVISWQYPTVNIIDWLGLNDYVIARHPTDPSRPRYMAHDRYPPVGYAACFEPNVKIVGDNKFVIAQRGTDVEAVIVACETRDWPVRPRAPTPAEEDSNTANLELAEVAPGVDAYLFTVWPADPSYVYFVPPDQAPVQTWPAVADAFSAHAGPGCLVLPPGGGQAYGLAFLPAAGRPALPEVQARFPWARIVQEGQGPPPFAYHLAYAAPAAAGDRLAPSEERPAAFANGMTLLGYDLAQAEAQPGAGFQLTLYYRVDQALSDPNFNLFVHLVGGPDPAAPALWAQDDGEPCRGLHPASLWQPGTLVLARASLALPADAPAGEYQLLTGLYNWQTGARLEAAGRDAVDLGVLRVVAAPGQP